MRQTAPKMVDCTGARHIRIAALQPDLTYGPGNSNFDVIHRLVERLIGESGLDLVILPEIFDGHHDPTDGKQARQFLKTLARTYDAHVIGGSCQIVDRHGCRFNRCFVIHRSGREVGHYDKRVLFASETSRSTAGNRAGVFDLDSVRIGVLICADMWHPELARELHNRIDLLAVPVMSGVARENQILYARACWHAMALTRALENGFAVVVSDWARGRHDATTLVHGRAAIQTHHTSGAACVIDPSHRPDMDRIRRVLDRGTSGVIRADIDLTALGAYRAYRQNVGLLPRQERVS